MIFRPGQEWAPWFAWRPVFITQGKHYASIAWLQTIYRCRPSFKYPYSYSVEKPE